MNNSIKYLITSIYTHRGFPDDSVVKNLPANAGDMGLILGLERSPGGGHWETHSSVLAWRIPWTEEPGGL